MVPRIAEMLEVATKSKEYDDLTTLLGDQLAGLGPHLEKMMNDPDSKFRRTLLEVALSLPKDDARGVVAKGLQDKDTDIAARATEILELRWADDLW